MTSAEEDPPPTLHDGPVQGQHDELVARLIREVETLAEEIAAKERQALDLRADCALDAADASAADEAVGRTLAEAENAQRLREQKLVTLANLREGTFGVCGSCGADIDPERMTALPHTRLCVRCKQAHAQPTLLPPSARPSVPPHRPEPLSAGPPFHPTGQNPSAPALRSRPGRRPS